MKRQDEYFKGSGVTGVPDEYSRPCGKPFQVELSPELLSGKTFDGIRCWNNDELGKAIRAAR